MLIRLMCVVWCPKLSDQTEDAAFQNCSSLSDLPIPYLTIPLLGFKEMWILVQRLAKKIYTTQDTIWSPHPRIAYFLVQRPETGFSFENGPGPGRGTGPLLRGSLYIIRPLTRWGEAVSQMVFGMGVLGPYRGGPYELVKCQASHCWDLFVVDTSPPDATFSLDRDG